MKKYKLIKQYPGSEPVGTVVELEDMFNPAYFTDNPDYYEEVIEKDFEILIERPSVSIGSNKIQITSIKRLSDGEVFSLGDDFIANISSRDVIRTIQSLRVEGSILSIKHENGELTNTKGSGIFHTIKKVQKPEYEILSYAAKDNPEMITLKRRGGEIHDEYWKIHSVKRLSDGEVFTVGDLVKVREQGSKKVIEKFEIVNDKSPIRNGVWIEYPCGGSHLRGVAKVQQPVYLTHDGKDIFPKDTVWYVNKENLYYDYIVAYPEVKFNSEIRAYFLTRQEAEEYVEKNKVLFTTEDGVGIKKGDKYYFVDTDLSISLSNASAGCGSYDERKYFSTYKTAEYYVIVNAKVLSIEEFWKFVSKPGSNVIKQKALKRLVKERLNLK